MHRVFAIVLVVTLISKAMSLAISSMRALTLTVVRLDRLGLGLAGLGRPA
jgi:hypothetical protein